MIVLIVGDLRLFLMLRCVAATNEQIGFCLTRTCNQIVMSAAVYRKVPVKSKLFDHDHASHARLFTGFLWDIWWEPGLLFRHWPMGGDGCAGPPEPSMRQPGPTLPARGLPHARPLWRGASHV
jgi:hypothetical protein